MKNARAAAAKAELFGSRHGQAAEVVRTLTAHELRIKRWSAYDAAEAMAVLPPNLVRTCITETREAYASLAHAMTNTERNAA